MTERTKKAPPERGNTRCSPSLESSKYEQAECRPGFEVAPVEGGI
jgi:hypothetical protein